MSSPFRALDNVVLALDRGFTDAVSKVSGYNRLQVGALIETIVQRRRYPDLSRLFDLVPDQEIVSAMIAATSHPMTAVFGGDLFRSWGFLALHPCSDVDRKERVHEFDLAAQKAMRFKRNIRGAKTRLCGAVDEMADNVYEHSEAVTTGLLGFYADFEHFQVAVGDSGIGMLESLRKNPAYGFVSNAGTAMTLALEDGVSRFGAESGRGRGFGVLFRALNSLDADIRFRSGDYALEVSGRTPQLRQARVIQKAQLNGFVVSISLHL